MWSTGAGRHQEAERNSMSPEPAEVRLTGQMLSNRPPALVWLSRASLGSKLNQQVDLGEMW